MRRRIPCPARHCPGVESPRDRRLRDKIALESGGSKGYRRGCWLCMGEGVLTGWLLEAVESGGVQKAALGLLELDWMDERTYESVLTEENSDDPPCAP